MLDQSIQIVKVWVQRPLNWIVILFLGLILLSSTGNRSTHLDKVYSSPKPSNGDEIISSSKVLLEAMDRGDVNKSITGIDSMRMGSITREGNVSVPFSEIGDSLTLFPNLQWIHLSPGELQQLRPGALANLRNLESIEVTDSSITQAGLDRLAEASSLSWLVIESSELEGTLAPLAKLPSLKTLELSIGYRLARTDPEREVFRREVLGSIGQLKKLERVAIDAQWHASGVIQEDIEASLFQLEELKEVWIGSQQTSSGRDLLGQLAASLPGVSVQTARYDFKKLNTILIASLIGFVLVIIAGAMLTTHFSTPQAKLIPGYAKPHRQAFFLFLIFALAIGVYSITNMTLIVLLPCASCVAFTGALAMLCLVQSGVNGPQNIKTLTWLPFVVLAGLYGLIMLQVVYPPFGCVMDRFLMGLYPTTAIAVFVASIGCVVWSLRQFSDQHRFFAESSLPPVVTVEDIKLYQAARYTRQNGMGAFERKAERWEQKFDATLRRGLNGEQLAKVMRWGYGGPAYDAVRRFGLLALPVTLAVTALPLYRSFASGSLHMVCLMMVGYMIGVAALIPVFTVNHDRSIISMELLRPVTRKDFIREKFTLAFLQVAGCLAFTFIYGSMVAAVAHGFPSITELFRRAVMFAITAVFVTSLAMIFCLIRNVFLAAILVLLELIVVGTVAATFVDDSFGGSIDVLGSSITVFRLLCIAIAITLASTSLFFSRRLWSRMEFGKV